MAGVPLIGFVIEEKANRHKIKHNPECDLPLPVKERPRPTRRRNGRLTLLVDRETELRNRPNEQRTILIFTDRRKNDQGVGLGAAVFVKQKLTAQLQFLLGIKCSNNQAKQLVTVKALEAIEAIDIPENSPRTIELFTNGRITIDLLKNSNKHCYLIEEIRKRLYIGQGQLDSRNLVGQGPRWYLRK